MTLMDTPGPITRERRGHIFLIGLNRPAKRNAFDLAMLNELALAYGEMQRDNEVRCGVLFAHGAHFTAGLDLARVGPAVAEQGQLPLPAGGVDPWGLRDPERTKPLVCALQGICLTAGIELALAADVRVAAADTRFAQIEIKRGIFPFGGATIRFPREVGWGNPIPYLFPAHPYPPDDARPTPFSHNVAPPA